MPDLEPLRRALGLQAAACAALDAPFCAALMQSAAEDLGRSAALGRLLAPWADARTRTLIADAVPIRLLGAIHHLALSGEAPAVRGAFPTRDRCGAPDAAWAAALEAMAVHEEALAAFMAHEPQTNEVRRSACLAPGFLAIAAGRGLGLRCFEIGASAGLNQLWDRYGYRFGQTAWGPSDPPLRLDTEWFGPAAPLPKVTVIERAACDRRPVDLSDEKERARLRAFIWADQLERLARLDDAADAVLAAGVRVERADAAHWTQRRVFPREGAATVLFHSIVWQYLPPQTQTRLERVIETVGAAATASAPFAWLRMEPPATDMSKVELRLRDWPGGADRRLAEVHPHGAWVRWSG